MSSEAQIRPPVLFWVMGVLFLLWAIMGCSIYLMEKMMTDEAVLKRGGQVMLDASHAYPIWAAAAYAVAVWGGLLATILFLLRRKLSIILFCVSLISAFICFIPIFTYSIMKEAYGSSFWVMPLIVVVIGIFEVFFSSKQSAKGILR